MTSKKAYDGIFYEVARYGEVTKKAMQLYVENRISYSKYQEAVKKGFNKHKLIKEGKAK